MALELANLDARTRQYMTQEIERDVKLGRIYVSGRLSNNGKEEYVRLLLEAAAAYDATRLAQEIGSNNRLNMTEMKRKASGGFTEAKVPHNAAEMLAEGEFNRFYIRALCLRAMADEIPDLVVYRAKAVTNPRPESEAKIGQRVDASKLLEDLRGNVGVDTALGLPAGPNSGLSVRI